MKHRNGLGFVRVAALAIACCASGCGAEGMNGEEATDVLQAAFAPVKGDVGFVQSNLTSGTGPVNAPSAFSFNSSGATNVLRRTGTGTYRVDVYNLPVAATASHIHAGAVGAGGPVIINFTVPGANAISNDFGFSGTFGCSDVTARPAQGINSCEDFEQALLLNNTYVNVHSTANPGGEIRGQLIRQ